ncbi:hypothetical protein D3C71_1661810 [compost metagenome]
MTAWAIAMPSPVDVPRPSSSIIIRLRGVACSVISWMSAISTINVLWPPIRSSAAPIRVNTRSITGISALSAGTKQPICARMQMSATWRI